MEDDTVDLLQWTFFIMLVVLVACIAVLAIAGTWWCVVELTGRAPLLCGV